MWEVEATPGSKKQRQEHPELLAEYSPGLRHLKVTGYLLPVLWVSLAALVKATGVGSDKEPSDEQAGSPCAGLCKHL